MLDDNILRRGVFGSGSGGGDGGDNTRMILYRGSWLQSIEADWAARLTFLNTKVYPRSSFRAP